MMKSLRVVQALAIVLTFIAVFTVIYTNQTYPFFPTDEGISYNVFCDSTHFSHK